MRDARARIIERRLHLASKPLVVGGSFVRPLQGCGPVNTLQHFGVRLQGLAALGFPGIDDRNV